MDREGLYPDPEISAALDWLGKVSGDPAALHARIKSAQQLYRDYVSHSDNLGKDPKLEALGPDRVASYFAQADALVRDRVAYDLALSPRIVPFIKHIGSAVEALRRVPGASDRALRMLRTPTVDPDNAVFELAVAVSYLRAGFTVEFIPEAPPERRPDFKVKRDAGAADVECKRLLQSTYAQAESKRQGQLCDKLSDLIHDRQLSLHIDVLYARELSEVPEDYLLDQVRKSLTSRIVTFDGHPWKDEFAEGVIRTANLSAVRRDTAQSSLYFGTKLARLLTGTDVTQDAYDLFGSGKPDPRDMRYLEHLQYCSVITWGCEAEASINSRARFIRTKLAEVDQQMHFSPAGIVHIGMDAQRDVRTNDTRRARNIEVTRDFQASSAIREIYLHYFVPLTTEVSAWAIDEMVDRFGADPLRHIGLDRLFDGAEIADNDLPAWYQPRPTHTT